MLYQLSILCKTYTDVFFVSDYKNYSSFGILKTSTLESFTKMTIRECIKKHNFDKNSSFIKIVDEKIPIDVVLYMLSLRDNNFIVALIASSKYPSRICKQIMLNIMNDFYDTKLMHPKLAIIANDVYIKNNYIEHIFNNYQDPKKCDKIELIKSQLDETKDIMINNINLILERGEKIEDLLQQSKDLNMTSKLFLKQTKKINSCCTIS